MTTPSDEYAVTAWGAGGKSFDFTTPSGQRCLLKKLELEDVLAHGLLEKLDGISTALMADEAEGEKEESILKAMSDTDKFGNLISVIDQIVTITVVRPMIYPVPGEHMIKNGRIVKVEREEGQAYIDQVSLVDKMAIFGKVFEGFKGLDRFREEEEGGVGTLEDVQAVSDDSELAPRDTL